MIYWIELAASIFQCVLCIDFLLKFNKASWKKNKSAIPILLVLCVWMIISDKILSGFSTISMFVLLVIGASFACLICKGHYVRALISACLFFSLPIFIGSLIYSGFSIFINNMDALIQGSQKSVRIIYLLITNILLFAVTKLILHIFGIDEKLDLRNGILSFIFTIISLIGMGSTMYLALIPQPALLDGQILLITIAFIFCNVILYILINQVQRLQKNKYELKMLEEKIAFEKAQYEEATALWENARVLRHDIKQHFSIILGQIEAGEIEQCAKYIREVSPEIEQHGRIIKTDSPILDYIINSKLANVKNTDIVLMGSIGTLNDIDDCDLASLLGNILDNALEALAQIEDSEYKHLELLFALHNSQRIIICKNTIKESVLETNKHLFSTKPERESHGFGHKIVERIVQKYEGTVDYFEEGKMFGVQIHLPLLHQSID